MSIQDEQQSLCERMGKPFVAAPDDMKLGIARAVREGLQPVHGLRHPPEGDTTGWYIWAGEHLSDEPDFFQPLHVAHVAEWCPAVSKYLGLPPGSRFLVAEGHEDVWFDDSLLIVE